MSAHHFRVLNLTAEQVADWWDTLPPLPAKQPTPYKCSIYAIDVPHGEQTAKKVKVKKVGGSSRATRKDWLFEQF